MSLYSDKVMEHFKDPKNVGEIKDADGVGEVGNPVCGDIMKIFLKVKRIEKKGKSVEIIEDIKFQTFGCGAAVATSSMVTELAKGKTIEEAEKITNKDVAESLEGLPQLKMHCSNLAASALKKAILDYKSKPGNV